MPTRSKKDPLIRLSSSLCTRLDEAESREWLLADGRGGYASGTVAGSPTRRYHGLLIDATDPPAGRSLLVHSVHERLLLGAEVVPLSTARWADDTIDPRGYTFLSGFALEGRTPTWTWTIGDIRLQKRIALANGVLEIQWSLDGTDHPVHLEYVLVVSNRSHHALLKRDATGGSTKVQGRDARIELPGTPARTLHVSADGTLMERGAWWKGFKLDEEQARGYPWLDDAWEAMRCELVVPTSGHVRMRAGLDQDAVSGDDDLVLDARAADRALAEAAGAGDVETLHGRLAIAADQFLVARPRPDGSSGITVIAGYPWFADWGRDTMISLPGLALATGREHDAWSILETFAAHEKDGIIPNLFSDDGTPPLYNTVDASLLFIEAVRRWHAVADDEARLRKLWPTIVSIIDHYKSGTMHGIGVDATDGLLHAGEAGLQLTWMDARVGDRVITPRRGKPVEINALWHAALQTAAAFAGILGEDPAPYETDARVVHDAFGRFWNEATGCLYDVLDGPGGDDASIRPNQLFALALETPLLEEEQARRMLTTVEKELLVPLGVRTLDQGSTNFAPRYEGTPKQRDAAYHQGTAWPWLLGPWVRALVAVHGDQAEQRVDALLKTLEAHLGVAGLGSVSEILDATIPYTPRGCTAQAWSVAVMLELITLRMGAVEPKETVSSDR